MTDGLLVEVLTMTLGSATTASAAAGATSVPVEDLTDFDETGGRVEIAGTVYDYTGVDEDADLLLLAQPLAAAVAEHEPVLVMVGGEPGVDYYAVVDLGSDDGDLTWVPLRTREERLAWPVKVYEPPLPVTLADDLTAILEAPGVTPQMDAAVIDPLTLRSASGSNAIHWSTEPPPDPPDELSIDGDLWWQRGEDESGNPTDALVGLWRFDGTAWQPQTLGSEVIAYLDAGAITTGSLTGIKVQTRSETDRGVKLGYVEGQEGLFVYDDSGKVFLKAVPAEGMAVVAGEVKARTLTVSSDDPNVEAGSSLGGTTEIARGGTLLLTGRTTAPKSAPTVTYGYDTVQFTDDGRWGNRRGWATDGTDWYTSRAQSGGFVLERWSAAGTRLAVANLIAGEEPLGVTVAGSSAYVLSRGGFTYTVHQFSAPDLVWTALSDWTHADAAGKTPTIGADPAAGELLLAQALTSGIVRIRRHTFVADGNLAGTSFVDTTTAYNQHLAGVWYGTADFGANRYVIANDTTGVFRPLNTSGVLQSAENWPRGFSADKVGFAHNGTAFVGMDTTGRLWTYTGIWSTTDADMTKWVSNTLAQGATPTYETTQSPRAKITMAKRSKLNVTTSPIPFGSDADRVRVYVGKGSTDPGRTGMFLQSSPAAGVTTVHLSTLAGSGTNPPSANGFPDSSPAVLTTAGVDAGGVPWVDIRADGPIGRDTGDLLAASPFTGSARFVRFGKIVLVSGSLSRASGNDAGYIDTGIVVPTGLRPAADTTIGQYPLWTTGTGPGTYRLKVKPTGELQIAQNAANGSPMSFSGVYFI